MGNVCGLDYDVNDQPKCTCKSNMGFIALVHAKPFDHEAAGRHDVRLTLAAAIVALAFGFLK